MIGTRPNVMSIGFCLTFSLLCAACGPSLQSVDKDSTWWKSSQDCAQGPFELSWRIRGARWGEGATAELIAPHAIVGQWRLELQGQRVASGELATRRVVRATDRSGRSYNRYIAAQEGQTQRCDVPEGDSGPVPVEVTAAQTSGVAVSGVEVAATGPDVSPQTGGSQAEYVIAAAPPELQAGAHLIAARPEPSSGRAGRQNHRFLRWAHSDTRLKKPIRLPKNGQLTLRIWSARPQDWRGARLRVTTTVMRPNVSEAEFVAHLKIKEAEAEADRKEQAAERKARRAKQIAQWRARTTRPRRESPAKRSPNPASTRQKQRQRDLWRARQDVRVVQQYIRRETRPAGPPPAALDEMTPPRPEPEAAWIAGHWRWQGRRWLWVHGWWKVRARSAVVVAAHHHVQVHPPAPPAPPAHSPHGHGVRVGVRITHKGRCGPGVVVRGQVQLHGVAIGGYIGSRCRKSVRNAGKKRRAKSAR